eukprot:m.128204 g.128204  ORF g.128204 m.128204 type:complete len:142 (+) comp17424_c1_seq1:84-509(+)
MLTAVLSISLYGRELLKATVKNGLNAYWYLFTATPIASYNMPDIPTMGSFHGAEVPFVFGDQFELSSDGERRLSAAMGCYWVNFAATGNPNNGPTQCAEQMLLPTWPTIGVDGVLMQMSNTTIEARAGVKQEQCDMFAHYS